MVPRSFNCPSDSKSGGAGGTISYFTEQDYENGSYLAPPTQSHLQLLDFAKPSSGAAHLTLPSEVCPGICDNSLFRDWEWVSDLADYYDPACKDEAEH